MIDNAPIAAIVLIGNEILSGRTADKNLNWLAKELVTAGIRLRECRVIPDIEETIIDTINHCRKTYTYVFTTGGIGPTHDDITSASVAKAFGVPLLRHPEAERILRAHYAPDQINEARLRMADIPQGGELIPNPVSAAPGFRLENVYVMAGVPAIMQAMFAHIQPTLSRGAPIYSRSLSVMIPEGALAERITAFQAEYPDIEIGSYPLIRLDALGTTLILRTTDQARLNAAIAAIRAYLIAQGGNPIEGE